MADRRRHLVIVAGQRAAGLSGFVGELPGGRATLLPADRPNDLGKLDPDVVLSLDEPPPVTAVEPQGEGRSPHLIEWRSGPRAPGAGGSARVIGPEGDGLWRLLPLPVADQVYELAPPPWPARILIAGGPGEVREVLVERLRERFVEAVARERLELSDLKAAAAVVLPGRIGGALPAEAMIVLAARRVLILPQTEHAGGLFPDIDHLAYRVVDQAADLADAVATHWLGFESMRAMGALAAEHHRASRVYGRLLVDLEVEDAAGLPSPLAGSPGG